MINSMARSLVTAKKWYRNISAGNPQYSEMELIGSTILTSNQAGVLSLTNIPQVYKHLQIRVVARSTYSGNENLYMRFNNASYSFAGHYLLGNGTSVTSGAYTGVSYADMTGIPNAANTSNVFGAYVIDILDYASTSKNKTLRLFGGAETGVSNRYLELRSVLIPTTSAITEITQLGGTASTGLAAGTRVSLYGIKG